MSKCLLLLGHLVNKSKRACKSRQKVGRKVVQIQSLGCFYHKSSTMFQPENSFVCKNSNGTQANFHMTVHHVKVARHLAQCPLIQPTFTVEASNKVLKTVEIYWKPQEVQNDPTDTVYQNGNELKNYKPQISNFLVGFLSSD